MRQLSLQEMKAGAVGEWERLQENKSSSAHIYILYSNQVNPSICLCRTLSWKWPVLQVVSGETESCPTQYQLPLYSVHTNLQDELLP